MKLDSGIIIVVLSIMYKSFDYAMPRKIYIGLKLELIASVSNSKIVWCHFFVPIFALFVTFFLAYTILKD